MSKRIVVLLMVALSGGAAWSQTPSGGESELSKRMEKLGIRIRDERILFGQVVVVSEKEAKLVIRSEKTGENMVLALAEGVKVKSKNKKLKLPDLARGSKVAVILSPKEVKVKQIYLEEDAAQ
ncbi:MAG: hypothetical protein HY652_14840 [Acidobacteria bacterium]|nr:hypothetical protein [Acidobacteriota bacterium]